MKPVYTLSPSKLESFRAFYHDEMFASEEQLIKQIKGEDVFKTSFEYGKAYHSLIENGGEIYLKNGVYAVMSDDMKDPIYITLKEAEPALKFRSEHPLMISEIEAMKAIEFQDYIVLLNMRVDGLEGMKVHEHKTTGSPHKRAKYENSLQWRIYLFTADVHEVQYNVFQCTDLKQGGKIVEYTPYNFYRYPTMESDIRSYCRLLISFCEHKHLLNYVEREHYSAKYYESCQAKAGSLIF
jgi:hypothetical protein